MRQHETFLCVTINNEQSQNQCDEECAEFKGQRDTKESIKKKGKSCKIKHTTWYNLISARKWD